MRSHQHIPTHSGSIQGIPSSFRQVSDDDKAFAIVNDPAGKSGIDPVKSDNFGWIKGIM